MAGNALTEGTQQDVLVVLSAHRKPSLFIFFLYDSFAFLVS